MSMNSELNISLQEIPPGSPVEIPPEKAPVDIPPGGPMEEPQPPSEIPPEPPVEVPQSPVSGE